MPLRSDTPRTTARGTTFTAPKGWHITVRGDASILELPEEDLRMAVVDVDANDADAAAEQAWAAYGAPRRNLKSSLERANRQGWLRTRNYFYETLPSERRKVHAVVRQSFTGQWTVVIEDVSLGTSEEYLAQRKLVHSTLTPKGYERESFVGKQARRLGATELAELRRFVTTAHTALGVPGVAVGVVQDGKVLFAEGFGVRELGKPAKVDAETLFMIASQSKSLTTLMLAKLIEEKKFSWETPVVDLYPAFKFRDPQATASLRLKHLVCACTGTPRNDWNLFEYRKKTPQSMVAQLSELQATRKPGERLQYSDLLVAAAGFIGAHAAYPELELGGAYDKALQTRVLTPLGMSATTPDHHLAQSRPNHATAHSTGRDGKEAPVTVDLNALLIAQRPAGGVWSNVTDVLKYVQLELANGQLPNGTRFIEPEPLLARRAPQVAMDEFVSYALGLWVDHRYGVDAVLHGGVVDGFRSEMVWWPQHGVGSVILTNGDSGFELLLPFRRKLLELLFDGRPEADASISSMAQFGRTDAIAQRKLVTAPVDPSDAEKLAPRYVSDDLGELTVRRRGSAVIFDFGEWQSEVGSRRNVDGSVSFRVLDAGAWAYGLELTTGSGPERTLKVRDEPYDYTFTEEAGDRASVSNGIGPQ